MDALNGLPFTLTAWTTELCLFDMDVVAIIAELRQQRERIEEAIMALERMAGGQGKRRGRPPKWMTPTGSDEKTVAATQRRARTAAQRKAQSDRMKRYWTARRKAA